MAYLIVDKDGTEKISIIKPHRFTPRGIWYCYHTVKFDLSKLSSFIEFEQPRYEFRQTLISTLPTGTIEKMIGRKLSWMDDPFSIGGLDT